jgi:dTDP-4-dehydrorhamnose reductase
VSRGPDATLELWGGIECTVNRVGDRYADQLEQSGHANRECDLDRLADLGICTVRYPLLWERVAPDGLERADWSWADRRLGGLRARGIEPIVGLVHHGSGPHSTSLIDPAFPELLAGYAGAVARRYPWVTQYTPINEPLTTARFSTLYGHWYPHARDDRTFARAIVNQLRAITLAMRAIREVNPDATLVQTEDLGKTFSTPALEYQAEFENERRWLTFDVLSGRLDRHHPMWHYLRWAGIASSELDALLECPSIPGILGINHYVTSERFLDERLHQYPESTHGGNGRDLYADVEAVRVMPDGGRGLPRVLSEAWDRYRMPLAVTEVHIAATREEQLRWLGDAWQTVHELRAEGTDVRAVTAWSLFGAHDWHTLLTRMEGQYEPGAFDIRAESPRPTALAAMVRSLARTGTFDHPVLRGRGWWRRPTRLAYWTLDSDIAAAPERIDLSESPSVPPILITGGSGTLGQAFARICEERGLAYHVCSRRELDITDSAAIEAMIDNLAPWAIVNAAGYVRVDDAEREQGACFRDNYDGPVALAHACARRDIALVTFSSDLVFDGDRDAPYFEHDPTTPLNVYGRSKAAAERAVLDAFPGALVVRTSAFFGPWDDHNFAAHVMRTINATSAVVVPGDEVVSPTFVPDLVHTTLDLLIDSERGIWHLANDGAVTWVEFARAIAQRAGLDPALVTPCSGRSLGRRARRPRYSALTSERAKLMPILDDAITRYFAARAACMQAA